MSLLSGADGGDAHPGPGRRLRRQDFPGQGRAVQVDSIKPVLKAPKVSVLETVT